MSYFNWPRKVDYILFYRNGNVFAIYFRKKIYLCWPFYTSYQKRKRIDKLWCDGLFSNFLAIKFISKLSFRIIPSNIAKKPLTDIESVYKHYKLSQSILFWSRVWFWELLPIKNTKDLIMLPSTSLLCKSLKRSGK